MSDTPQTKDTVMTKFLATILAGMLMWMGKDLYTRVLDQISKNSERITDLRIIVESLKK